MAAHIYEAFTIHALNHRRMLPQVDFFLLPNNLD